MHKITLFSLSDFKISLSFQKFIVSFRKGKRKLKFHNVALCLCHFFANKQGIIYYSGDFMQEM